jgi:hypothetical protein
MLGAIMAYARAGMPQLISSLSIAGATSPVTMEGTLVVQNAEVLAGIVLTQLIREGTPVVFSGSSSAAAMRYGTLEHRRTGDGRQYSRHGPDGPLSTGSPAAAAGRSPIRNCPMPRPVWSP